MFRIFAWTLFLPLFFLNAPPLLAANTITAKKVSTKVQQKKVPVKVIKKAPVKKVPTKVIKKAPAKKAVVKVVKKMQPAVPVKKTVLKKPPTTSSVKKTASVKPVSPSPTKKILETPVVVPLVQTVSNSKLAGSYRCSSYNVSGGGSGNCRLFPPIVLASDGTYAVSSEKGTYKVSGTTIILSESKLRGPGTLIDGNKIRFEYDYNSWHHVITYLKEGTSETSPTSSMTSPSTANPGLSVQVILEYPKDTVGLSSISVIQLVPQGSDFSKELSIPTAIAVWDKGTRIVASFANTTYKPVSGKIYDVYENTGIFPGKVGSLDLTTASGEVYATLKVSDTTPQTATIKEVKEAPSPAPLVNGTISIATAEKNRSLGSLSFIVLIPENDDPATTAKKMNGFAVYDGDRTTTASFTNIRAGMRYDVYADWGFGSLTKLDIFDLTATTSDFTKTFTIVL